MEFSISNNNIGSEVVTFVEVLKERGETLLFGTQFLNKSMVSHNILANHVVTLL